uniref:Secreted protein n=1 Tax=Anopheles coluzzii TaxID=1518534 RepID=A0A8W7NZV6_ANOCL
MYLVRMFLQQMVAELLRLALAFRADRDLRATFSLPTKLLSGFSSCSSESQPKSSVGDGSCFSSSSYVFSMTSAPGLRDKHSRSRSPLRMHCSYSAYASSTLARQSSHTFRGQHMYSSTFICSGLNTEGTSFSIIACMLSVPSLSTRRRNEASHRSHWYGLLPTCVFMCFTMSLLCAKLRSQYVHLYGFSPVWVRMCRFTM